MKRIFCISFLPFYTIIPSLQFTLTINNKTYLVPKHWAVAVGIRTKLAQKQKKIPQTHRANRGLAPNSIKLNVK